MSTSAFDAVPAAALAAARRRGVRCVRGIPVIVDLPSGVALVDIAELLRSDRASWLVAVEVMPGIRVVASEGDAIACGPEWMACAHDAGAAIAAIRAASTAQGTERHTATGDWARAAAGAHALQVTNAALRARVMDAVDGWSAQAGAVIDDGGAEGILCRVQDETVRARLLRVVCPSTARHYYLLVPQTCRTAREARAWTMGLGAGESPEVES